MVFGLGGQGGYRISLVLRAIPSPRGEGKGLEMSDLEALVKRLVNGVSSSFRPHLGDAASSEV